MRLISLKILYKATVLTAKLALEDGSFFTVCSGRLSALNDRISGLCEKIVTWEDDCELSEADIADIRFASACYRAETAALSLISRAEQCSRGLEAKLLKRGCEKEAARVIIDLLRQERFIDDERFARAWVSGKLRLRRVTPLKLRTGLRRRGVDGAVADRVVKALISGDIEKAMLKSFLSHLDATHFGTEKIIQKIKTEGFSKSSFRYILK